MYEIRKRLIQVVSIQGNDAIERESAATTWGALKDEFPEIAIMAKDCNVFQKEGKVDIFSDSHVLPNNGEPVVIYLYVQKMKAGYSGEGSAEIDAVLSLLSPEEKEEAMEMLPTLEDICEYISELIPI